MKKQELLQVLQNNVRELENQKEKTESAMAFVKLDSQIKLLTNVVVFVAKNLDDDVEKKETKQETKKA